MLRLCERVGETIRDGSYKKPSTPRGLTGMYEGNKQSEKKKRLSLVASHLFFFLLLLLQLIVFLLQRQRKERIMARAAAAVMFLFDFCENSVCISSTHLYTMGSYYMSATH